MRSAVKDIIRGGGTVYLKPNGRWQVDYLDGQEHLCLELARFEQATEAILRIIGVSGLVLT